MVETEYNESIMEEVVFNEKDEERDKQLHIILDVIIKNHLPRKE